MKFGSKKIYIVLFALSLIGFVLCVTTALGENASSKINFDKLFLAFTLFFLFVVTFYEELEENTIGKPVSRLWRTFLVCMAMLFGQALISSIRPGTSAVADWGAFLIIGITISAHWIAGLTGVRDKS